MLAADDSPNGENGFIPNSIGCGGRDASGVGADLRTSGPSVEDSSVGIPENRMARFAASFRLETACMSLIRWNVDVIPISTKSSSSISCRRESEEIGRMMSERRRNGRESYPFGVSRR